MNTAGKFNLTSVARASAMPRRMLLAASLGAALVVASKQAAAQSYSAVTPTESVVEGPGVKIGEGTVIHPTVGLETGAISNVFFTDEDSRAAGVLRLLVEASVGSLSDERKRPTSSVEAQAQAEQAAAIASEGKVEFRASLGFLYSEFLSGNENVRAQRDVGINGRVTARFLPQSTWQPSIDNWFQRFVRPTNFESKRDVDRNVNRLRLQLDYKPRGRSISGYVRYENTIDIFENEEQSFADRFLNNLALRANWQFLPVTRFYADAQIGLFTGFGANSQKLTSFPLRTVVGAETAITEVTTVSTHIGYGNGFYTGGPNFGNVLFGATFGWRYSPNGKAFVTYDYNFQDSVNSNFYRDHLLKGQVQHNFVPFAVTASAEARLRRYEGLFNNVGTTSLVRDDVIFAVSGGALYNFKEWLAITADYQFTTVQTDFTYMPEAAMTVNPSFVRHQLLAGVRAAL